MEGFMGIPFREPTPEEKAEYEEKVAKIRMEMQAARDARRDFFDGLTVPQLVELNKILWELNKLDAVDAHRLVARWTGTVTTLLEHTHKVCGGCGKDHLAEDIEEICIEGTD